MQEKSDVLPEISIVKKKYTERQNMHYNAKVEYEIVEFRTPFIYSCLGQAILLQCVVIVVILFGTV